MSRSTRTALILLAGLALLVVSGWLLVMARPLLVSLIIGGLLAFLFDPVVRRLAARLNGRRGLATGLVFVIVLALFAGAAVGAAAVAVNQWPRILAELQDVAAEVRIWFGQPISIFGYDIDPALLVGNLGTAASNALSTFTLGADGLLAGLSENLIWTLVVVISFFYLLRDGTQLRPWLLALVPREARPDARELWDEIVTVWNVFLRVQLLIFFVLSVLVGIATALILWFFRQGWLQLSPIGLIILMLVVYAAIQQVDNLWLRPKLMGGALKLHPGVVIVALLGMLVLSGLLGALLIVPVLATLKVLGRFAYTKVAERYGWELPVWFGPQRAVPDAPAGEERKPAVPEPAAE